MCVIAVGRTRGGRHSSMRADARAASSKHLRERTVSGTIPLFLYPPLEKTFAQMSREEKNRVSHRGRAMARLGAEFDRVLEWLALRLDEEPGTSRPH